MISPVAFSVFFSKSPTISPNYREMMRLTFASFKHTNPGTPFYLFTVGCPETVMHELSLLFSDMCIVHNIPLSELPSNVMDRDILLYSLRYHSYVREVLSEYTHIGYFDLDIVHVAKWNIEDIAPNKVGAVYDIGVMSDNVFYRNVCHFYSTTYNLTVEKYYNSGVIQWIPSKETNDFMEFVWDTCVHADGSEWVNYVFWYDQHMFNVADILYKTHMIQPLPVGHNVQGFMHQDKNNDTKSIFWGMYSKLLMDYDPNCQRYHVVSYIGSPRNIALKYLAERFLPEGLVYPEIKDLNDTDFAVVVISHNQSRYVRPMIQALRAQLPFVPITMVFDRCTDDSVAIAEKEGIAHVVNRQDGFVGFRAGSNRNIGKDLNPNKHILFLDGDRIPSGLNMDLVKRAATFFGITCISLGPHHERRGGLAFSSGFKKNTQVWPGSITHHQDNSVYSSGVMVSREVIQDIGNTLDGQLFLNRFDGVHGDEDIMLGNIAGLLGYTAGFFPISVSTAGEPDTCGLQDRPPANRWVTIAFINMIKLREQREWHPLKKFDLRAELREIIRTGAFFRKEGKEMDAGTPPIRTSTITGSRLAIKTMLDNGSRRVDYPFLKKKNKWVCPIPFKELNLNTSPRTPSGCCIRMCCGDWLNERGKALQQRLTYVDPTINGVLNVWKNNDILKTFRKSIKNGSYTYCSQDSCPHLKNPYLPVQPNSLDDSYKGVPTTGSFSADAACNLKCPSCRHEVLSTVQQTSGEILDALLSVGVQDLWLNGSGELFINIPLLTTIRGITKEKYPNLTSIQILTNGSLLTPRMWESIPVYPRSLIRSISVSVDATTKELYEQIRRGGSFKVLVENLKFIGSLRKEGAISYFSLSFVIQKRNVHEILNMLPFTLSMGANSIDLHRVQRWEGNTIEEYNTTLNLSEDEEILARNLCAQVKEECNRVGITFTGNT